MGAPTDGHGLYDTADPTLLTRLDAMAAAGFKLVMNYSLLTGHTSDMIAYINHAATLGMKVIISLENAAIWANNTIATTFPIMYAESGNQSTDQGFTQYVVNQVKGLPGTWGYYIGDELFFSSLTAMQNHAGYVHTADSSKPRLIVEDGTTSDCVGSMNNSFFSCCEVLGDDYYPLDRKGVSETYNLTTECQNAQSFVNAKSIQSCIVPQAFNWGQYAGFAAPGSRWPSPVYMRDTLKNIQDNMSPRLILWFSYDNFVTATSPYGQMNALSWAINNQNTASVPNTRILAVQRAKVA